MGAYTAEHRAAALNTLRAGALSYRQVAARHGVSRSTLAVWAKREGIVSPREGLTRAAANTTAATAAHKRAQLQELVLDDALWLQRKLRHKVRMHVAIADTGRVRSTKVVPDPKALGELAKAVQIATVTLGNLDKQSATEGTDGLRSTLGDLGAMLTAAAGAEGLLRPPPILPTVG